MLAESKLPSGDDSLAFARERVRVGAAPAWVNPSRYEVDVAAKPGDQVTSLLIDRQLHADRCETYYHFADRLETMQAVQHESQWRLQFEPRTQVVTVHWIRTCRDGVIVEHATPEKIRILQREERLEGFVIDGLFTLLLVLEDVRPGDILETCYTIEFRRQIMPENCESLFPLPLGMTVGKFSFSVRFAETRPMKWKSSAGELVPEENREKGEILWTWSGENLTTPKPEPNTPVWHMGYPWIQVSDCVDWATVGAAVARAWPESPDDPALAGMVAEIIASESDLLGQIDRAIRLVQDEHRYLSVNLELGAQIPSPPAVVARRRFGNCKDLSFLLVNLLQRIGVTARPILVHTQFQKSVAELLPSAGLFNHAIVEFRVNDHLRWIDPTIKRQGGGALHRFVPHFGVGLPVDLASTGLSEAPRAGDELNSYEVRETFLLDTTGEASWQSVTVVAKGQPADSLRFQFETLGVEQVAKDRLTSSQQRWGDVKRLKALEYRDDRAANEFVLAETFEIGRALIGQPGNGICRFVFTDNFVTAALPLPDKEARLMPFALPFPCHAVHVIEIEAAGLRPFSGQRSNLGNRLLRFERRQRSLHGFWSMTFTLTTLEDSVAPGLLDDHRELVEGIWRDSAWQITMPIGNRRPRPHRDFGQLPRPTVPPPPYVQSEAKDSTSSGTYAPLPPGATKRPLPAEPSQISPEPTPTETDPDKPEAVRPVAFTPPELDLEASGRPRRRTGSRRASGSKKESSIWPVVAMIMAGIVIFYVIVSVLNR